MSFKFVLIVVAALSNWNPSFASEGNDQPVLLAQVTSQEETAKKMMEIANSKQDMSNSPGRVAAKEGMWNAFLIFVVFFFVYHGYKYYANRGSASSNGDDSRGSPSPKHKMIKIPGGNFEMGAGQLGNAKPVHKVAVKSFMLSNVTVTQEQWSSLMNGRNPSCNKEGGDHPVNCVTWDDAQGYITKLNEKTGKQYRLPTEAEWEYAARAGSIGKWCFGDDESQLGDFAWYEVNYHYLARKVGQKKPNSFGLYDMHGLIQEWVQDVWHPSYKDAPLDGSAWTEGKQNERVIRGGSGSGKAKSLYSASRNHASVDMKASDIGFRIALS